MYGHFLFDCLMPDILNECYRFDVIYRPDSLRETIGQFKPIYEEVLQCTLKEISPYLYHRLDDTIMEVFTDQIQDLSTRLLPSSIITVQKYIFDRYNIQPSLTKIYPKVLLLKRGDHNKCVEDHLREINVSQASYLSKKGIEAGWISPCESASNSLVIFKSPAKRRETNYLEQINDLLNHHFKDCFERVVLEDLPFSEQVNYFKHAKLIVGCHGAGFTNLLFSQKGTTMLEIKPTTLKWSDFDVICRKLDMKYRFTYEHSDVLRAVETEVQQLKKEILK